MTKKLTLKPTSGICIGAAISIGAIYGFSDLFESTPSPLGQIVNINEQATDQIRSNPASEPSRISILPDDDLELLSAPSNDTNPANEPGFSQSGNHRSERSDRLTNNSATVPGFDDELDLILSNPISFSQSVTSESVGPLKSNIRPRESTALQAVQHIEYGKALARRGAMSSAKQEFFSALSVLTQDYDAQSGSNAYSRSLQAGLLALKEAEDFAIPESAGEIGFDSSTLVESHHSGVLQPYDAKGMSLSQVREAYFNFAESQILQAVGKNVISAEVLYSLGRLYSLRAESNHSKIGLAQAAIFHRAAIHCNPKDHRSTNELGVLLSEFGELNSSVELLKQSLRIQPNPQTWENLSKLHRRLNQHELADSAAIEHQRALTTLNTGLIQWMEPQTFNSSAPPEQTLVAALPGEAESNQKTNPNQKSQTHEAGKDNPAKSVGDRIKSWF